MPDLAGPLYAHEGSRLACRTPCNLMQTTHQHPPGCTSCTITGQRTPRSATCTIISGSGADRIQLQLTSREGKKVGKDWSPRSAAFTSASCNTPAGGHRCRGRYSGSRRPGQRSLVLSSLLSGGAEGVKEFTVGRLPKGDGVYEACVAQAVTTAR